MANKKENISNYKDDTKRKKNTTTSTKKSSVSKTTSKKSVKKVDTPKKSTSKKTNNKSSAKKTNTVKKTPTKKIEKELNIEQVGIDKSFTNQEKIEKEIIDEINSIKVAKIENAKYKVKKKDKTLLAIGVFISLLGIIALIVSLIANRIIDREFINDTAITLMICGSIIIEGFGAFIIINET